ncbi:cytochrome c [Limnohabitans sp.]|uniref:c-type cytochrome n=1 Tax=Limnohabitans sp. TaxID=1907725 RepID=UPI00286EC493|nr:cytochrome c [Limnohabitans sp.]
MKVVFSLLPLSLGLLLQCSFAHAQDRKIEQAIKHRKAAFTLMATYVNRMVQTVDGHRPFDAKQMTQDSRTVELLSKLPWEGFVEGSERGDTRAKDDIWFEEDKFKRYANELQVKSAGVTAAAESGDLKRFKAALGQMRDACNACHKAFRKD